MSTGRTSSRSPCRILWWLWVCWTSGQSTSVDFVGLKLRFEWPHYVKISSWTTVRMLTRWCTLRRPSKLRSSRLLCHGHQRHCHQRLQALTWRRRRFPRLHRPGLVWIAPLPQVLLAKNQNVSFGVAQLVVKGEINVHINTHGKESNVVEDVTFVRGRVTWNPIALTNLKKGMVIRKEGSQRSMLAQRRLPLEERNRPQERMPRLCSSQRPHPLPDPRRRSRCLRVWRRSQWSHQLRSSMWRVWWSRFRAWRLCSFDSWMLVVRTSPHWTARLPSLMEGQHMLYGKVQQRSYVMLSQYL